MIYLKSVNEYLNTNAVDFFYNSLQDIIKPYIFDNNFLFNEKSDSKIKSLYIGNILPKNITKVEKILTNVLKTFCSKHDLSFFIKPETNIVNRQMLFYFLIKIRDPKTKRIIPPKYIFHTTTKKNTSDISINGLSINKSDFTRWYDTSMFYDNAIFCSTNPDNIFYFQNDFIIVLNTIDMKNIWYRDVNSYNNDWIMTYSDISHKHIVDIIDIDKWDMIKNKYS
jgi:hypothetical protein